MAMKERGEEEGGQIRLVGEEKLKGVGENGKMRERGMFEVRGLTRH